jgi:hypothetical protein
MTTNGNTKSTTTETPKTSKAAKPTKPSPAVKAAKETTKVKAPKEAEDRLPATIEELKETKAGLVTYLFLSGKDKDEIVKELKAAFNLTDAQAVKVVRRITDRARFFQRASELMAMK